MMESLDPRIQRLDQVEYRSKTQPDQLHTYEVFTQLKEGKLYFHTGIVHAADIELAFLFAKEQFSRRQTCTSLWVVNTADIFVTEYTEGDDNVFGRFKNQDTSGGELFDIFILLKRGKQHQWAGTASGQTPEGALANFAAINPEVKACNAWICRSDILFKSSTEMKPIWDTLPEKGYRDALAYKAGDKLKQFLEKR